MQNKYISKVSPTYPHIFLKPFQPKAFVSVWGQHWPFNSVYMTSRKNKSLVKEDLNLQELPQSILSNYNLSHFCWQPALLQSSWLAAGTCGVATGLRETQRHKHLFRKA